MAEDSETAAQASSSKPTSIRSNRSAQPNKASTSEQTPLLAREDRDDSDDDDNIEAQESRPSQATAFLQSLRSRLTPSKPWTTAKRRWPSLLALLILFIAIILVIVLGFITPAAMKEYATQAVDFQPKRLSLVNMTDTGVTIHVKGTFVMDAARVQKKSVRDLGRFGTWIAKEVETGEANVMVFLPEYDDILAGKATIPPRKFNIRNGQVNPVDFYTVVEPGLPKGLRDIANDWLDGRLGEIALMGHAEIPIKSGIINLGKQTIQQPLKIEGSDIPSLPHYDIAKFDIHEIDGNQTRSGMSADAIIRVKNDFPVSLDIPAVGFDVMVDGCTHSDPYITVGNASTRHLDVKPKSNVNITASGDVKKLPHALTKACPNSDKSPLDQFLGTYIHGEDARIFINCCTFPEPDTPKWASELLKDVVVPLPFPGRTFDHLLKNFTMSDVEFHLPELWAEPGSPASSPKISANILAFVTLPEEMNFRLDVGHVRADAMIYYKKKKLGRLDLHQWQNADSIRVEDPKEGPELKIISHVEKAPLEIIDEDAFTEVVQALLFGGKTLYLEVQAKVDVQVDTPVGELTVQQLPAAGVIPVKPMSGRGGMKHLNPQVGNLEIVETTEDSVTIQAAVNFTNPTNYTAVVPYFRIDLTNNGTALGHVMTSNVIVIPGNNTNVIVTAIWEPGVAGGLAGHKVGRELLSQYLSGYNTTLTLRASNATIPAAPLLGHLLSSFPITIPTPHLRSPLPTDPSDPDRPTDPTSPHFITSTTMHILTSTATFDLASPFRSTTIYLTWLNATAFYHKDIVGEILTDELIEVPPGMSTTQRLPVDWSLGSVGFEAIKKALGGQLKLNARADVGVRIGEWEPRGGVWVRNRGIGAKVRV